jgi:hypothetical protein
MINVEIPAENTFERLSIGDTIEKKLPGVTRLGDARESQNFSLNDPPVMNIKKTTSETSLPCGSRPLFSQVLFSVLVFCVLSGGVSSAFAETCQTSDDLDPATRTAITTAGQRYFEMTAKDDAASLRKNAIADLAANFSGIEDTVKTHQAELAGAQARVRAIFELEAEGTASIPRAEFFCGVFNGKGQTSNSAVFVLTDLPPGKYAVAILDASSPKARAAVSFVLQLVASEWKVGGLYIKSAQLGGHDSDWFTTQARAYKTKGQMHNAWLYYLEARSLASPVPFMSTGVTDKLYDESQSALPGDFPAGGKTTDLPVGGTTYKLADIFPQAVGDDLDLVVKYEASDISNTNVTYQANVAVMKALLAKYPELKDGFAAVVARAVDRSGRDYGTMLPMKDIK